MKITDLLNHSLNESIQSQLAKWVQDDQSVRNAYAKFVQDKFHGDYNASRQAWMKLHNTTDEDFFGTANQETSRHHQLLSQIHKLPYDKFTPDDWKNFWIIVQHADHLPELQRKALDILKQNKHVSGNLEHIRYLTDRILNNQDLAQKYHTQSGAYDKKFSPFLKRRWGLAS